MSSLRLSRFQASVTTFLLSSFFHELVMWVMLGKGPYGYLFAFQMMQIPLIWLGSLRCVQEHPAVSNFSFWTHLVMGPVLLTIVYCREHYLNLGY